MTQQHRAVVDSVSKFLPSLIFMGGVVAAFAVMGEKVNAHEREIQMIKATTTINERYNAEDHKAILQKLGEIQGTLEQMRNRNR